MKWTLNSVHPDLISQVFQRFSTYPRDIDNFILADEVAIFFPMIDNSLGFGRTDARELHQLVEGGGIDIDPRILRLGRGLRGQGFGGALGAGGCLAYGSIQTRGNSYLSGNDEFFPMAQGSGQVDLL